MCRKRRLELTLEKTKKELESIYNIDRLENLGDEITYFTRRRQSYYAKDYVLDLTNTIVKLQELISDEEGMKYLVKIHKYVKKQTKQLIEEKLIKLSNHQ